MSISLKSFDDGLRPSKNQEENQEELCVRDEVGAGWDGGCICSACHPEDGTEPVSACAYGHRLREPVDVRYGDTPLCEGGEACEWNRELRWDKHGASLGTHPRMRVYMTHRGEREVQRA